MYRFGIAQCLFATVAVLLLGGCGETVPETGGSPAGKTASVHAGAEFELDGYRGKVLVLNIWGTWCPPCRVEVPALVKLREAYDLDQVAMAGITVPNRRIDEEAMRGDVRAFVAKFGVNYDLFLDADFALTSRLDRKWRVAGGVPVTLVIDPQGVLRNKHVGLPLNPNGKIDPFGVLSGEIDQILGAN